VSQRTRARLREWHQTYEQRKDDLLTSRRLAREWCTWLESAPSGCSDGHVWWQELSRLCPAILWATFEWRWHWPGGHPQEVELVAAENRIHKDIVHSWCPQCGEEYLTPETVDAIEQITQSGKVAKTLEVPVYPFSPTASA